MQTTTPPCQFFAPLVLVAGRVRVGRPTGSLRVPSDALRAQWLPAAIQRPIRTRNVCVQIVREDAHLRGVLISSASRGVAPISNAAPPEASEGMVILGPRNTVMARTGALHPAVLSAVTADAQLGEWLVGSTWVRARSLASDIGTLRVIEFTPAEPVPVPMFAHLTATQLDVSAFAAQGLGVADIAMARSCSRETVKSHLRSTYERLGVGSRAELVPVVREYERWRQTVVPEVIRAAAA